MIIAPPFKAGTGRAQNTTKSRRDDRANQRAKMKHKVQHDKRAQLQSSLRDSLWRTAPVIPAINRWAILNRPAGARRTESQTTNHEPRFTIHAPRRVIAPDRESHRSHGKLLTRSNSRARRLCARAKAVASDARQRRKTMENPMRQTNPNLPQALRYQPPAADWDTD